MLILVWRADKHGSQKTHRNRAWKKDLRARQTLNANRVNAKMTNVHRAYKKNVIGYPHPGLCLQVSDCHWILFYFCMNHQMIGWPKCRGCRMEIKYNFLMRPRFSLRGYVRPSVGPFLGWLVSLSVKEKLWKKDCARKIVKDCERKIAKERLWKWDCEREIVK